MQHSANILMVMVGLVAVAWQAAAWGQSLEAELRALDALRSGLKTPLDAVDAQGELLLKTFERPEDQAQIHYMLAHIHAQSGMRRPKRIVGCANAALDSRLLTSEQRGTLYSYVSSAHEVDRAEKEFAVRRRNALAPLLAGLKELQAVDLPVVAPELPIVEAFDIVGDPDAEIRARERNEAQQRARREAERVRGLVQCRNVLTKQVKYLYCREPKADDELKELAGAALGEARAAELVELAAAERKRIAEAREERQKAREQRQ